MRNVNTIDYENKYKAALNWIRDIYPTLEGAAKEDAENYFTELKESDDENIKPQSSSPISYGKELEKRMNEACNRFFAPNTDVNRYSASDLFYAGVKAERDLNMSAWSEEDERMIRGIVSMCDVWATSHQFYPKENKEMEALKTWLYSLKERFTWKPSVEQIEILDMILTDEAMDDNIKRVLKELREDLKKLKNE